MSTGENIRTLRILRGITQQQLAERLGVSGAAVSEWERGQNEPRSVTLQKTVEDSHWVNPDVLAKHPRGFYLRVEGESMNRILPNGCLAFVDPKAEIGNGDIVALHVNGYDATIKRYHRIGRDVILEPDSTDPSFSNELFDASDPGAQKIDLIGRVVWHVVPFGGS